MVLVKVQASCVCKMNIPSGMLVLEQRWGVDQGLMEAGCRCCYCHHKRVAVMITKNTVRYNCPVRGVPTKDNVRVSVDVGLNFHIGRSEESYEEDAKRFFYNFGPNRLAELLH